MEPEELLLERLTETVTDHSIDKLRFRLGILNNQSTPDQTQMATKTLEKLRFRLGILNNQLLQNNQTTPDQMQIATETKEDRETERLRLGTLMENIRSTTPT